MTPIYTRQDYKNLLDRAKLAQANGDPEAKYVITWMESLLKPTQWETSLRNNGGPALPDRSRHDLEGAGLSDFAVAATEQQTYPGQGRLISFQAVAPFAQSPR